MSIICAATCDKGRYDTILPGTMPLVTYWLANILQLQVTLSCESMTALGGPVVPEV